MTAEVQYLSTRKFFGNKLKSRNLATPVTAEQQQCDPFLYQYSRYQLHCSLTATCTFCKGPFALRRLRFSVIDAEDWSVAGLANSDVSKERSVFIFWGSGVLEEWPHTGRTGNVCTYYVIGRREWKMGQVVGGVSRAGHRRLVPIKVIT